MNDNYLAHYIKSLHDALQTVDQNEFRNAEYLLYDAYSTHHKVFVCGNGGSAAISDHFNCDHSKGVHGDTTLLPKVECLTNSMSLVTAIANDIGYDQVFSHQLKMKSGVNDVLVVISSSGNSENIINAIKEAKKNHMKVIALTGFDGGRAKELADARLHVQAYNYGVVEDSHQAIMHALAQSIRINNLRLNKHINDVKL